MLGPSHSKPKPSSKSKGNYRRNKQGRNDQGWTEWEYDEGYKQEWRDRIGPNGKRDVEWRQPQESVEYEDTEEYEESAETESTKNVEIPRRLNPIQIPKQRQGDDEVQLHEYTHEGEPDTGGTSSQRPWATYQSQSVSSQNTLSGFQEAVSLWNPQSSPQGAQWPIAAGLQVNPSVWKPQQNFQASSIGTSYNSPSGQARYPGIVGSYAPLPTPQGGYGNTGHTYSQQQNRGAATGYCSTVNQTNLYSSTAPRAATGQSGWGADSLPTVQSGYSRGALGAVGSRQREEEEDEYDEEEEEADSWNQDGDEGGTVPPSSSPPDRRDSSRDAQLPLNIFTNQNEVNQDKYGATMKSMAGLAFTEQSTQDFESEVSTEEQRYGNEPSQILPGSLGRPGQPASYDPNDSQNRQYRQNQSRRGGYNRRPPILDESFQRHNSKLFKKGKVFKCLWSEPIGNVRKKYQSVGKSLPSITEEFVTNAKYGETAYHGIRRFVIVKERKGHSLCVPILTYGSQGTNKPGVKAEYHAMVYSGQEVPSPLRGEQLVRRAVRIEPSSPEEKLDPKSRVNYAKVYTIEHNIRVCFIGKIHPDSRATFETDFRLIDNEDVNES